MKRAPFRLLFLLVVFAVPARGQTRPHAAASVAVSPDARRVAVGYRDGGITLWTLPRPLGAGGAGGAIKSRVLRGHFYSVDDLWFSPDGRYLVSASRYTAEALLWDGRDGRLLTVLARDPKRRDGPRWMEAAFSPDGKTLAVTAIAFGDMPQGAPLRTGLAALWDLTTRKRTAFLATTDRHASPVDSLQWLPNGQLLTASDATLRWWDPQSGKQLRRLDLSNLLGVSDDGSLAATARPERTVQVRTLPYNAVKRTLSGHTLRPVRAEFSPDNLALLTIGYQGTMEGDIGGFITEARAWDLTTGNLTAEPPAAGIGFSPRGHTVVQYTLGTLTPDRRFALSTHDGAGVRDSISGSVLWHTPRLPPPPGVTVGARTSASPPRYTFVDLGPVADGFRAIGCTDVNRRGQVVGFDFDDRRTRGVLWNGTVRTDLGPVRKYTRLFINDAGEIAFTSEQGHAVLRPAGRAFLWRDGNMYDLTSLTDLPKDLWLVSADAVSDAGWIVGTALPGGITGEARAYLLKPRRPPTEGGD